ncbi:MAG: LL-diaminopimelate aminotransferase [Elusimicrobia bacterium]|nr:LL-diaminopimelate aminotransferase [Elusimicrobiota bacterium]
MNQRLQKLPPYLFAELDRRKKAVLASGVDLISLGVGDPDKPTPSHIIEAAKRAMDNPSHHKYPFGSGLGAFREAVCSFMKRRFGVEVDATTEIYSLIGSKEGIGHLPLGVVDVDDVVLVPDPGYPVYQGATILAGAKPYYMPLLKENNFLPDLDAIPIDVRDRASLMFIGYPNNPTSASATREFFEKVIKFARDHQIVVAHDNAYSEMYYGEPPISFLSTPGAKEVGVEFHSLSKTYNMTGWRIGWVCGNKDVVKQLATVKDNFDSGVFEVVQSAGIAALTGPQDCVEEMRKMYKKRRDVFVPALKKMGWDLNTPDATFYVWARTPLGLTSMETVSHILDKAAVLCTPGHGFGPSGEGYVRFALTVEEFRLQEAIQRISKLTW